MNIYRFFILLTTLGLYSCVEKYDINITNKIDGVVIEASISNISYSKTLDYPSEGRYFQVKVKKLSDVNNISDYPISNAQVTLLDNNGNVFYYTESSPGIYALKQPDFKAIFGVEYKINVKIPTGEEFESSWETLPQRETEVGKLSIEETSINKYVWGANRQKIIKSFEGIDLNVELPENNSGVYRNYKWDYELLWIYIAPRPRKSSPVKKCWMKDKHYLNRQTLEKSKSNTSTKLFFLETLGNYRVYTYFSVLIVQKVLSDDYYNFNKDLEKQSDQGGIFSPPPFNLQTNYKSIRGEKSVYGYFGVYTENATRWTFNKDELSYRIINDIAESCGPPQSPAPDPGPCETCLKMTGGPSTSPPQWWIDQNK